MRAGRAVITPEAILRGGIGRTVIDDQHFQRRVGSARPCLQGRRQVRTQVVMGHTDADQRPFTAGAVPGVGPAIDQPRRSISGSSVTATMRSLACSKAYCSQ